MEHHAVPQQVTSYEFRLVGSMTLKQFIKLASGLILAFIFYHSKLIFFIKWPLVAVCASLGTALAFLPVNEQPLEKWIFAFFHSIYSPTIFIWQKQPKRLDFAEEGFEQPEAPKEKPVTPEEKEPQIEEFLASIDEEKMAEGQMPKAKSKKKEEMAEGEKPKDEGKEPEIILERKAPPEATAETEFGEIPMPEPPKTPNKVVGMVFDQEGKLIENAIIEIQDKSGNAVRALRTNRLGQFETATPLSNGEYLVTVEKEGYNFDILKLEAKGEILEPLRIKAKSSDGNG